jgi:hypothetical protein
MASHVQVGTILIEDRPLMAQTLAIESDPYVDNWSVVRSLDGFALDRKIHAAGWNFFFMAGEVKAMVFGGVGEKNIRKALKRILAKMSDHNFNCLEVAGITGKLRRRAIYPHFRQLASHSRKLPPRQYPAANGRSKEREMGARMKVL